MYKTKGPCGVRIYKHEGRKLVKMIDVISPDFSLPEDDDDEVLMSTKSTSTEDEEAEDDDMTPWTGQEKVAEAEATAFAAAGGGAAQDAKEAEDDEDEEELDDDEAEEAPAPEQNFIRLLFSGGGRGSYGGHYDLLSSATQRDIIVAVFPHLAAVFE